MKIYVVLALYVALFFALETKLAYAHPGRTASDGCHYCRTNCDKWGVAWNVRHCHAGYSTPYSTPYVAPPIATPKPTIEVQAAQTKRNDNSFWTGLITLGILGGGLYWVIKKIKT